MTVLLIWSSGTVLWQSARAGDCGAIENIKIASTAISSATVESDGRFLVPDPSPFVPALGKLPAFCRVTGVIRPEAGSAIGFEIWLPTEWNRRLLPVGNGPDRIYADDIAVPYDSDHDVVAALVDWVEKDKAPERIIATHYEDAPPKRGSQLVAGTTEKVSFTRPVCVFPKQAAWIRMGSPNLASNYACR